MALLTNINGKFSVSDAGAVTFNNAFTFPTTDGTANYVLKTNGSGTVSWSPDVNTGTVTGSGTLNKVARWTATGSDIGDGPIIFSNATTTATSTFGGNVTAQGGVDITGTNNTNSTLRLTNTAAVLDNSWSLVPQYNNPDLTLLEGATTRVTFKGGSGNVIFTGSITGTSATFSGTVTSGGTIYSTLDSTFSTDGSISRNATVGLVMRGVAGSVFDLALYGAGGTALMTNSTGTNNIVFNSGNVTVSAGNVGVGNSGTFDNPNSYSPVIEIAAAGPVGLILNDTRDTHPMSIANEGAVMNLRYNTTSMLALDGATSSATFAGTISTTGITTSGVTNNFSTGVGWGTNLALTNTNDDVSPAILTFRKAPVSGYTSVADGDYVGFINFRMDNTNNDEFSWVEIAAIARDVTDGSEDSSFSIGTWGAGTEHPYTIMARSGNVGIGTDSPGARIDIKGVAGSPATSGTTQNGILRIQNATNNNTLDIGQVAGSPYGTWLQAADKSDLNPIYTYPISLNPLGGNVGIGTTSPATSYGFSKTLEIQGVNNAEINISQSANSKDWSLGIVNGANYQQTTAGQDYVWLIGGSEKMRITSGGDVEVANSVTGGTFTVGRNGNNESILVESDANNTSEAYIRGYSTGAGSSTFYVWSNGNVQNINNSYTAISDIKLKENIVDATPKLDDLMKVKIKNYNLIGTDLKQIGVVAQELEDVFPNLIDEHQDKGKDENGKQIDLETTTKSVKYSVFVPILIKAIQELKAEIEILKNK